jgi:hypothetical protein
MAYQLVERKYGFELTNVENTASYTKIEGNVIARSEAMIEGQTFSNQGYNYNWKKAGRGKEKKVAKEILIGFDSEAFNLGYTFR